MNIETGVNGLLCTATAALAVCSWTSMQGGASELRAQRLILTDESGQAVGWLRGLDRGGIEVGAGKGVDDPNGTVLVLHPNGSLRLQDGKNVGMQIERQDSGHKLIVGNEGKEAVKLSSSDQATGVELVIKNETRAALLRRPQEKWIGVTARDDSGRELCVGGGTKDGFGLHIRDEKGRKRAATKLLDGTASVVTWGMDDDGDKPSSFALMATSPEGAVRIGARGATGCAAALDATSDYAAVSVGAEKRQGAIRMISDGQVSTLRLWGVTGRKELIQQVDATGAMLGLTDAEDKKRLEIRMKEGLDVRMVTPGGQELGHVEWPQSRSAGR